MKFVISMLCGFTLWAVAHETRCDDSEDKDLATLAVQNRTYSMRHEFVGWFGVLPMDAFTKGMTFSGGYTLHFNDVLAWEVGQFTYSYHVDTNLNDDLENLEQPAAPTPFEVVKYYATSSIVFKPIYVKMAVLNSRVVWGEFFVLAGGGYGKLTITQRPVIDYGGGARLYIGEYFSVRLDVRNNMFLNKEDVLNELWVALGASLSFQ